MNEYPIAKQDSGHDVLVPVEKSAAEFVKNILPKLKSDGAGFTNGFQYLVQDTRRVERLASGEVKQFGTIGFLNVRSSDKIINLNFVPSQDRNNGAKQFSITYQTYTDSATIDGISSIEELNEFSSLFSSNEHATLRLTTVRNLEVFNEDGSRKDTSAELTDQKPTTSHLLSREGDSNP